MHPSSSIVNFGMSTASSFWTVNRRWVISKFISILTVNILNVTVMDTQLWSHSLKSGVFSVSASASASPWAWISYLEYFHVCFSCAVSLIKTIINYCYWQFGWILFHSRNIHINSLAEDEPDISGILWSSLSQKMKCLYFLNETISSQIASSNN